MIYRVSRLLSLTIFAILIVVPSLIVTFGSFKTTAEVYTKPLSLPEKWTLDNYRYLFEVMLEGPS
jgi:raffinose/stachyose/melibiose transport system permease protein